jgi:cytochrome c oxidase cbb3-type subunit I/II
MTLLLNLLFACETSPAIDEVAAECVHEPSDQSLAAHLAQGRRVYNTRCATCHGVGCDGDGPSAHDLESLPWDFTAGLFKFRSTPLGSAPVDADLARTVRNGIPRTSMPASGNQLFDADIDAVAAVVKSCSDRFDAEPVESLVFSEGLDFSAEACARGAPLFGALCGSRHAPDGKGDGAVAAGMVDLWGNPVTPAELTLGVFKRGNDSPYALLRTVSTGIESTAMVSWYGLPEQQRADLVAHVMTLGGGTGWLTSGDVGRSPVRDGLTD